MSKRPTTGLLLGKFLPPHRGHEHLINFAAAYADIVTVHVCPTENDLIPGPLRYAWMRETFAGRENIHVVYNDDPNPQTPEDDPDHFWEIWYESLLRHTPEGRPDYVFASEPYGFRLAEIFDAAYLPVDHLRLQVPTSGTAVRNDPLGQWEYLLPATYPYYAKRIALVGPESSGKSTMAQKLATHFRTVAAPEYARTYLETIPEAILNRIYTPGGFDAETMHRFIRGQAASVEAMVRLANRVIFSDTEAVVTAAWCEHFLGEIPSFVREQIQAQRFDLYLLTAATETWAEEAQRVHPDYEARLRFEERCVSLLNEYGLPYVRLAGSWADREAQAIQATQEVLAGGVVAGGVAGVVAGGVGVPGATV